MIDTPKSKGTAAIYARVSTKDKGQDVTNPHKEKLRMSQNELEEIERLRARIAALEEAARPFLDFFDDLDPDGCREAQKRLAEVLKRK